MYKLHKVSALLKDKGITTYRLSKDIDISMAHAYRIMNNKCLDVKVSTLLKLSRYLEVPAALLLEDEHLGKSISK